MKKVNWSLSPQATANFGLVLVVLLFNSIVVHRNTVALQTAQARITHTHEVFAKAQALASSLSDAESAVRGYVIAGDQELLKAYHRSAESIPDQVRSLRELVRDNPGQSERLDEFVQQADGRIERLQTMVALRSTDGFDAARERLLANGNVSMDQVRQALEDFQHHENQLLSGHVDEQDYRSFVILAANLAAVIVGVAITVAAWFLVERELGKRRAAEASAHLERQNLWVTLTSIADGVIVADEQGRVKLANPVAQELMGWPENPVGQPFSDAFPILDEATQKAIANPISEVLSRGDIERPIAPTVLRRADGTEIPIEQSAAPIRDARGNITGVVFVFRDCSARRRIDREMSEREQQFRRVFESPLIGIGIGTSQGNLLEVNDVYLDLIGYRRGQIEIAELSWDGRPYGLSPLDDAARLELRENGVCKPFERTYTRTDGNRVPVLISAARLFDDRDRIVIFVTDLSQSKRAEAALRESEARFRVLSECMPQKVWVAARDGEFEYFNNMFSDYTRLPSDQLKGSGWTNVIHPDDVETYLEAWNQSLSTGDMFEIEHRVRKHTGEYRWHLARALPVYKPNGEIAMWVGTNTDIHDQKQAEEALREEHHRKDRFLALLAHELRNPLAPLSNAIQVFPTVQHDPANCTALLGIMQRQVRQMTRLIDDLLDLARITTGRMRLRREPVLAATVVAAAVEAVQPLINERQHQLTTVVPPNDQWLDADPARLAQILINLLHNAAKYTDVKGQLSLTVEQCESDILFHVRDNGPGITKEMLTRIFDLFTQVELTLDRAHGGLGIGLTLVRTLVELHGGSITAFSEGLGHGAEFTVRMPSIKAPQSLEPELDSNRQSRAPRVALPVLRVMVVDDVQASAKTFALMLQTLGQTVEVAFDGPTAIARAQESTFDLIFMDIAMPGMDGLEAARRLRSIPKLASTMLVALTGFGQDEDRAHSLNAGFNDHLTKPTSLDLLKEILIRTAKKKAAGNGSIPAGTVYADTSVKTTARQNFSDVD